METFLNNLEYYTLDKFEFVNGEVIENATVEFLTGGTPKYDEEGNITNAILYCHGSSGNYSSIKKLSKLIYPGDPFDKNEYFFVSMSGLGAPESCSPSTTELLYKFPSYKVEDMVNFQRQFLKEHFNITHLKGIMGNSMGGFLALTWAALYPDEMDFIIPMVSTYKTAGHNYILAKLIDEIISSDPEYPCDSYDNSIYRTLKLATQIIYSYGMSREYYRDKSNYELNISLDEFGDEGLFYDIHNVKYNNDAVLEYDIEDKLGDIKAKTLIIAVNQDQYFPPELDAVPMSKMIKDSNLICIDSELGHVAISNLEDLKEELQEFMDSV